jgi:hypothetical protein
MATLSELCQDFKINQKEWYTSTHRSRRLCVDLLLSYALFRCPFSILIYRTASWLQMNSRRGFPNAAEKNSYRGSGFRYGTANIADDQSHIFVLDGDARLLRTRIVELGEGTLVLVPHVVLRREVHRVVFAVMVLGPVNAVLRVLPQGRELRATVSTCQRLGRDLCMDLRVEVTDGERRAIAVNTHVGVIAV